MSRKLPLDIGYSIKKNRYWVDGSGKVYWKDKSGEFRRMRPFTTKDGYTEYVLTRTDGTKQHIQEQIISIIMFKGRSVNKYKTQVNHKDGKRGNNKPSNLEWVTPKQNIRHSFESLGKKVWNSPNR